MGITKVQATIMGEKETKEYTFIVDTGSTYIGLPLEEIEAIGVQRSAGKVMLETITDVVELDAYFANGEFRGRSFAAIMIPTASPIMGYELLENLLYKVNPVTQELERVPDDERHPPYGPRAVVP